MYKWTIEITNGYNYDAEKIVIADDFIINDDFIEFYNGDIQTNKKTVILINKRFVASIKSENA